MSVKDPISVNSKCHATAKSGKPCAAPAARDSQLCSFHSVPNRASELGRLGGQRNRVLVPDLSPTLGVAPTSPSEIIHALGKSFQAVLEGNMKPNVAYALSSLASVFLKAYQLSKLEGQLSELEEAAKEISEVSAAPRQVV